MLVHDHDSFQILIDIFGILNVLLAYVHLSYQALVLNYMKSIRGYYCLLGLSCPLLIILRSSSIFRLSSSVCQFFLLGDEAKVVGHDEGHHAVIYVSNYHGIGSGQTYA
jgi:hypothetical protein